MVPATASFLFILALSAGLIGAAWLLTWRLTPEHKRSRISRWLLSWSAKGLLAPMVIWAAMNLGVSWNLQPFMPEVQEAQNSGAGWAPEFLHVLGIGLFILSTYWSSATLAWVLVSGGQGLDPARRKDLKALGYTCLLGLSIPALILLVLGGWTLFGVACNLLLIPMAGYAPALLNPQRLPPMYARALARMKFGKYNEAEWEIIRELEKCEDDFEGWMMLADLYANQFRDIGEARRTVLELIEQPRTTAPQLSVALHRLADWHLKLDEDPTGARQALQTICQRLRGTHLAHMAQLRLAQLPNTAQELKDQQTARPIPLPGLGDPLDDGPAPTELLEKAEAARRANACVARLQQDPNNVPERERLARLFAEHLHRPELGLEQIQLLLGMYGQPEAKRAEWLALIGAWHLRLRRDPVEGRAWLNRLIHEYPQSPQAFAARRRLQLLDRQLHQPISVLPNVPRLGPEA